jgi:thiosulfate dehydrogenase (quinone) large subunit
MRNITDPKQAEATLFGQPITLEYSGRTIAYAILALRIVMGWILLQGGLTKIFDPSWTAAGYLNNAVPEGNPFTFWSAMAGAPMIDFLNQWGLTLTGLGLILGALVRFSAFWGAVMMFFYWLSSLEGGLSAFLPVAHGWVIDDHIVYIALLFGLGAVGAGRIAGVDAWLERTAFVKNNGWLRLLLG